MWKLKETSFRRHEISNKINTFCWMWWNITVLINSFTNKSWIIFAQIMILFSFSTIKIDSETFHWLIQCYHMVIPMLANACQRFLNILANVSVFWFLITLLCKSQMLYLAPHLCLDVGQIWRRNSNSEVILRLISDFSNDSLSKHIYHQFLTSENPDSFNHIMCSPVN
jgi:hypothetical protein